MKRVHSHHIIHTHSAQPTPTHSQQISSNDRVRPQRSKEVTKSANKNYIIIIIIHYDCRQLGVANSHHLIRHLVCITFAAVTPLHAYEMKWTNSYEPATSSVQQKSTCTIPIRPYFRTWRNAKFTILWQTIKHMHLHIHRKHCQREDEEEAEKGNVLKEFRWRSFCNTMWRGVSTWFRRNWTFHSTNCCDPWAWAMLEFLIANDFFTFCSLPSSSSLYHLRHFFHRHNYGSVEMSSQSTMLRASSR